LIGVLVTLVACALTLKETQHPNLDAISYDNPTHLSSHSERSKPEVVGA
jgi:hypothetical protein